MIIPVRFHILTVLFFAQTIFAYGQSTSSSDSSCENQIRVINQSSCQQTIRLKSFTTEVSVEDFGLLQPGEEKLITSEEEFVFVYAVNDLNQQVAGALSRNCEVLEFAIASCFVDQQGQNSAICESLNLGISKNNRQKPISNMVEVASCGDNVNLFIPEADGIAVWTNTSGEEEITFVNHNYEISADIDEQFRGEYTIDWYDTKGCYLQRVINLDIANCCALRNEMIKDSIFCRGDSLLLAPRLSGRNICSKDLRGYANELHDHRGNVEDLDNFVGAPDSYGPSLFKFNTNEQTYVILKLDEVVPISTEICVYTRLGQCNDGNTSDFKISAGLRPFSLDDDITYRNQELSTDYDSYCLTISQPAEYVRIDDLGNKCGIRFDAVEWNRKDYFDNNEYEWNTGETTPTIMVNQSGLYTLKMTDCKGCSTYNEVLIGLTNCNDIEPPDTNPCDELFNVPFAIPDNFSECYGKTRLDGDVGLNDFDLDSFDLVWELDQRPKNGTIRLRDDGKFFYFPDEGFTGTDDFYYTVCKEDFNPCNEDNLNFKCATGYVTLEIYHADLDLGDDVNICSDDVHILSVPQNFSVVWSTGQTGNNIAVNNTGTYQVTATDISGCQTVDEITVNVDQKPSAAISKSNDINCEASSTILTATGGERYEWNTGQSGQQISVNLPGEYFVTVSNANGCTNMAQINVEENIFDITPVISGPSSVCSENEVIVLSAFGGDTYEWSNGESGQSIQVVGSGTYTVTATNNLSRCKSEKTIEINVANTFADAGQDIRACPGESVIIGADIIGPDNAVFAWENGASGILSSSSSGKIVVAPTSTKTYTLTVSQGNCIKEDQVTVFVNEFDFVTTQDVTICPGGSTILSAAGAESYSWNTGQTSSDISVSPNQTTTYSVIGSNGSGCNTEKTITVNIADSFNSSISNDKLICPGESVSLSATGGSVYQWSNGAIGSAITVNPNFSTNYTVTITNNQGCSTTESVNVNVEEILNLDLGSDKIVCRNTTTELSAPSSDSYLWSTGETTQLIRVSPNNTQAYSVTITQGNCSISDEIILEPQNCNGDISGYTLTDVGDPIPGVSIFLFNDSNELVEFMSSSASGYFLFSSRPAGRYRLEQSDINGFVNFSDEDESPDDDNDVDGANNIINVDLKINESDRDNIFRDIRDIGTINGYVYTDTGVPIIGVKIYLYDENNSLVYSTSTDANGFYQFVSIPTGSYTIIQEDLRGYISISDLDESPDDPNDQDGANNSINVVLNTNEVDEDNNFRDGRNSGSISGFALTNTNIPIPNSSIFLFDLQGQVIDYKTTNQNGFYRFSSVPSGSYILEQADITGYTNFSDLDESPEDDNDVDGVNNRINVFLDLNESDEDNNFRDSGNSGSISGLSLLDDGTDGVGDRAFSEPDIFLFDANNNLLRTTQVNNQGQYSFSDLPSGIYYVEKEIITGYQNVYDRDLSTSDIDPDGANDPIDGRIFVNLTQDEIDAGNDFLVRLAITGISGYVRLDVDGDGTVDEGQANVSIDLLNRFGNRQSRTTTDQNGYYEFISIPAGEYFIEEDQANDSRYISLYDRDESINESDPDGYDESADNIISVILEDGEHDSENNFVNIIPNYGRIAGYVLEDQDGDDIGDTGMGGINITLYNLNDDVVARVQTNGQGRFIFEDIQPGNYYLVEADIVLFEDVSDYDISSDDPNDVDGTNDVIFVTVDPNELDDGNTFVNRRTEGAIVENCTAFKTDNFTSGTSRFWILGGDNAEIEINQGIPGLPSIGFVDLNNDNGIESSIYSTTQDFSYLNSLILKFQFYVRGADPDDYFLFELSTNGGSTFKEINRWNTNIDFNNNSWNLASVTVPKEELSQTTVLRIRSELSSPNEHLYLDEIIIEGCFDASEDNGSGTALTSDNDGSSVIDITEKQHTIHNNVSINVRDVNSQKVDTHATTFSKVYPNPAIDEIFVDLSDINSDNDLSIEIFAMDGSLVKRTKSLEQARISIDISGLKSEKLYLIYLQRQDKLPEMFRFLKIN